MRDYIVELVATSKKQIIVTAETAEEAGEAVDLIIRRTDLVKFDNDDVKLVEVEVSPNEKTDYADNDIHISEIVKKQILKNKF